MCDRGDVKVFGKRDGLAYRVIVLADHPEAEDLAILIGKISRRGRCDERWTRQRQGQIGGGLLAASDHRSSQNVPICGILIGERSGSLGARRP